MGTLEFYFLSILYQAGVGSKEKDLQQDNKSNLIGSAAGWTPDEVEEMARLARTDHQEEASRTRQGFCNVPDPGRKKQDIQQADLSALKKKFGFLKDYSDEFIQSAGVELLIKAETSARKLQDMDRSRRAEDKLLSNRENLGVCNVEAGTDDRLNNLHSARFLPGPTCTQGKVWTQARDYLGSAGHPPLSSYDMASFGLGGCTSARGWVEIHDLSSTSLSVKMFAIGNFTSKVKDDNKDSEFPEMDDISEFKTALRVLRGAMSCVYPWNRSIDALESFFIQTNYCSTDLSGAEKQVSILTRFADYVLAENGTRWRDGEVFLTTRDLRGTWADFFGQKGGSLKQFQSKKHNQSQNQNKSHGQQSSYNKNFSYVLPHVRYQAPPRLFEDDICALWNMGKCARAPGQCFTHKGKGLRHVCNHRFDWKQPDIYCGKEHPANQYHK